MASVKKSRFSRRNLKSHQSAQFRAQQQIYMLETIYQPAIRSQAHFFHNILERYELFDVQVWLIGKVFGCWVEVDIET